MIQIYVGDCREIMAQLPVESINACITSPPYWSHREYKTRPLDWADGWVGHLGNEPSPEQYRNHMLEISQDIWSSLHPSATFWLNLGDTYARRSGGDSVLKWSNTGQQRVRHGNESPSQSNVPPPSYKAKDLIGIPWLVATALRELGWYLRMDNIWAKGVSGQRELKAIVYQAVLDAGFPSPVADIIIEHLDPFVGNPTPDPVKDRPTKAHEYVFLLSKSARYYYDHEGSKEPATGRYHGNKTHKYSDQPKRTMQNMTKMGAYTTRNRRSVWTIPTRGYKGAHFAVMAQSLADMCVAAAAGKQGRCDVCKSPLKRIVKRKGESKYIPDGSWEETAGEMGIVGTEGRAGRSRVGLDTQTAEQKNPGYETLGWEPSCKCEAGIEPCVILDPFGGSGTTAIAANKYNCDAVLIELSEEYAELAASRILKETEVEAEVIHG